MGLHRRSPMLRHPARRSARGAGPAEAGSGPRDAGAGFFKECGGVLRQAVAMRCRAIRAHTGRFQVIMMCRTLAVSPSGYYAGAARPESRRAMENRRLMRELRVIHEALQAQGQPVGEHRVAWLMRAGTVRAKIFKKERVTTDSVHPHPAAPNTRNRQFAVAHQRPACCIAPTVARSTPIRRTVRFVPPTASWRA